MNTGFRFFFVFLLFFLLFYCKPESDNSQNNNVNGTYTLEELQADFSQMRTIIESTHPSLYMYYDRETFNRFFDTSYTLLRDGMNEAQFYRILSFVISKINCGHTSLSLTNSFSNNRNSNGLAFPYGLAFINNRAFIYQNYSEGDEIPLGTEILSVNNEPISSILSEMLERISSDGWNLTKKIRLINRWFYYFYYNLIDNPETFVLNIIKPLETSENTISISALNFTDVYNRSNSQNPSPYNGQVLSRQEIDPKTSLLAITSFSTSNLSDFKSFLQESFQEFINNGKENLIIDLRGNGGGDPYQSVDLLSYLIDHPFTYFGAGNSYPDLFVPVEPHNLIFRGNVYFLIDGACFSTTGHFCSLAKYHQLGVFIGEETGGSFYCNDNSVNRSLSISGLNLRIARTLYATAVPDSEFQRGRGVFPDYEVTSTLDDLINGIDRQMLFVLDLIKKNEI